MIDNSSDNCLTEKSDFVGWLIKIQVEEKGYMDENFCIKSTDKVNNERKAYNNRQSFTKFDCRKNGL